MGRSNPTPLTPAQRELAARHFKLPFGVAQKRKRYVPASVDVQDLAADGMYGLVTAARSYNPDTGVKFNSFAERHVIGAMREAQRRMDFLTRTARANGMKEPTRHSIETRIADGSTRDVNLKHVLTDHREQPGERERQRDAVRYLTRGLDNRARSLIELCYVEGCTMREAGERAGLTESRVCQIVNAGLKYLRENRRPE